MRFDLLNLQIRNFWKELIQEFINQFKARRHHLTKILTAYWPDMEQKTLLNPHPTLSPIKLEFQFPIKKMKNLMMLKKIYLIKNYNIPNTFPNPNHHQIIVTKSYKKFYKDIINYPPTRLPH